MNEARLFEIVEKEYNATISIRNGCNNAEDWSSNVGWSSDSVKPTWAEITAFESVYQADYDSKQYQRDRALAYPSLEEQADMAYWDRQEGTTTLDDAISAVKAQYPKP